MNCKLLWGLVLLSVGPVFGWDKALPGYQYEFPRDHFAHPSFQSEWWYYTGNVATPEGRPFGFELTFFRQAVKQHTNGRSPWEVGDLYLAHLALSDVKGERFYKAERLNRAGPGLAGADAAEARIWNGNWEVRWLEPQNPTGRQRLRAVSEEFSFEFELTPRKSPVIHGRNGVSQKAAAEGQASHYTSFTRLAVVGSLRVNDQNHRVSGTAWMDHEFFTHSMGPEQVGWDWISLQLDNNAELMIYRLRRTDGSADPYSSGTYIAPDGSSRHLERSEFDLEPVDDFWESLNSGGRYPLSWRVAVPSLGLELAVATDFREQEVVSPRELSPSYWEGAITARGRLRDRKVSGIGYLEMTGYDRPINLNRVEALPARAP